MDANDPAAPVKLKQPIQAHGKEVTELTFRKPNGADIRRCGIPYSLSEGKRGKGSVEYDAEAIAEYISCLAGIPGPSVDQLCPADFKKCMVLVMGFFGDETLESA